ncbi:LysR family transcriptional regulator [Aquincola sp. S2]|uniref:LysR family transcriptional regulator n=1 Tax=Pseudaquabacterium terrae TaxID=2732868 RepID=A0ABX2EKP1_9BURK|nr:LysR family transcriptional regulator [Aquabacterium terrae]NRF69222.1 LysR family transcriptional regulator [Aquabacterium terrae]
MNLSIAATPSPRLDARDLELVLALVRGGTLAEGGRLLGQDLSTVFRALKRLEQRLGLTLFERGRSGLVPGELALALAKSAEAVEDELDRADALLRPGERRLAGTLRVTTTDTMLIGLLLPLVAEFRALFPLLTLDFIADNQLASLSRREADVAIRATTKPPEHLVGARLGPIRSALWAHRSLLPAPPAVPDPSTLAWVSPDADESLADHLSVRWRRRVYPQVQPALRCNSILAVAQAVRCGAGVGVAPRFLLQDQPGLVALTGDEPALDTELWLLTHPDVRHLRRIKVFFDFVRERLVLP